MWLLPRFRFALARRPWLYWLVVGLCGTLVWLQWSSVQQAAERSRRSWGAARTVAVAAHAADPGEPLHVELRSYPLAVVPTDALATVPEPAVAARSVSAGAVLVPADLAGPDALPVEWVVLAVPAHDGPTFVAGQHAAVFTSGARPCDGTVAAASPERVEVAVPPDCAAGLTDALLAGTVVLARLP